MNEKILFELEKEKFVRKFDNEWFLTRKGKALKIDEKYFKENYC